MTDNTAVLFLAQLINERETKLGGYSMPVRLLCLREDLRDKYIAEAEQRINEWWSDEMDAKKRREISDVLATFDTAHPRPKEG